ncbi:MAG TPA: DNA polymerase Y family protein [Casimicrobiaceae bacterium]|nr:DNA polymerase Y family protein [Casimicrobiaceae bacterium]
MLFAALHFPSLPLDVFARALPPDAQARPIVVDSGGHVPRILAMNNAARGAGIREQMLLSAAYALAPSLVPLPRDPVAEHAALKHLATFVLGFTPMVSLAPPSALVAEIGASLRLFGGRDKLVSRLAHGVAKRGFTMHLGIAPTPIAALAFARADVSTDLDAWRPMLDAIPLVHFDLPDDARTTLASAGIRSFGEVDRLPRDGVARRFGQHFVDLLDRATGRQSDPRVRYEPPPSFVSRLELPTSVDDVEALGFALHRLVQEISAWLLARGLGITALSLALLHERALARHRDSHCTQVRVAFSAPSRTPKHLMHVVRERLQRLSLPAPVVEIALTSESVAPLSGRNLRLLPGEEGLVPEVPLVDRLRARLGEDAVQTVMPHAEHRPESATFTVGATAPATTTRASSKKRRTAARRAVEPSFKPAAPRPLWLLDVPRPLAARLEREPWVLREGPERIESGWWDGHDVRRDYYVAESPNGEIAWIYRDHRYATDDGEWFVHGWFA